MSNLIKILPMDYNDINLFETISKWHNREDIKKNFCINFSKEDSKKVYVGSEMQESFRTDALERLIITFNDEVVGHCNYAVDLPAKKFKKSLYG